MAASRLDPKPPDGELLERSQDGGDTPSLEFLMEPDGNRIMRVARTEENRPKTKPSRSRQFLLLVLALGLFGVAGHQLRKLYRETRNEGLDRSLRRVDGKLVPRVRVASSRYVLDIQPPFRDAGPERPGSPAGPSLAVKGVLPEGIEKATLSISAGDPRVPLVSIPVRAHFGCRESPIHMEMRHFVVEAPDGRSWSLSIPCPPLLQNLRAVGSEEAIHLSWDRLNTAVAPWASGPEIVVLRAEAEAILAAELRREGRKVRPSFAEVARIPTTACGYRDETVQAGRTYVYRLATEGEVTASVTDRTTGAREQVTRQVRGVAPVLNRMYGVVATAESPNPLRLALLTSLRDRKRERSMVAVRMLRSQLPSLPWVMLTERDMPQEIVAERVVTSMGQDRHGVAATALAPAEAGLLVEVPEFLGDELQVWLEDYLGGRRRLVARAPMFQPQDLFPQVAKALALSFPERTQTRVAEERAPAERPRVAVLAFRPTNSASAMALSRAAFREMLAGELASSSRFQIVDREWTDALFAEQERLALQGEEGASQLGHVLGADYLLTGTYRLRQDELVLEACLVEVAHGTRSNLFVCHGTLPELAKLARQLDEGLRVPRPFAEIGSAMPLAFAFKIDNSLRGGNYRRRIDVATLARSRDPEDMLLAAKKLQRNDPKVAWRLLEQLLARGPGPKPERLAEALTLLDGLLCDLGKTERRVELWRQMAADLPAGKLRHQVTADLRLAQALATAGKVKEARELVRAKPTETRDVVLLASLGMYREAVDVAHAERWLRDKTVRPGYARAVFLLRACPQRSTVRRELLAEMARRLSDRFPRRTRRALRELEEDGGVPDDLLGIALVNAAQSRDNPRLERLLGRLPRLASGEHLTVLSRCLGLAAKQGDRALAKRMLAIIRDREPADREARQIQETRLRLGLPRSAKPAPPSRPPATAAAVAALHRSKACGQQLGDTVYVVTKDEVLVAFDDTQRRILWQLDLEPRHRGPHAAGETLSNTIWAEEGTIYVPVCQDGRLLAVDAKTGKVKWTHTAWGWIGPPVVTADGKQVVVGELGCVFLVLDAASGSLVKSVGLPALVTRPGPATHADLGELRQLDCSYTRAVSSWVVQNQGDPARYSVRGPHARGDRGDAINWGKPYSLNLATWEVVEGRPPPVETREVLLRKLADPSLPMQERYRRVASIPGSIPSDMLLPVLAGIVANGKEATVVRQTALSTLARRDPDAAVETVVELLDHPSHGDTKVAVGGFMLTDYAATRLDDESVQMLVRLFRQPSAAPLRNRLAIDLVHALGAGARELVVPLLPQLLAEAHYMDWADPMGRAMAQHGMVESLALLVPRMKSKGFATGDPCYRAVLALARDGCDEARQYVSLPFAPEEHLALLRQAKPPLTRVQRNELARPYRWICTSYPSAELAPFLRESLRVAPEELRAAIAEAQVRVGGDEDLLNCIREDIRSGETGSVWRLARPVTGLDLGDDRMAWEQAIRYRRRE